MQTRKGGKPGLFWITSHKDGGRRAVRDSVVTVPTEPETQGPGFRGTEAQLLTSGLEPWRLPGCAIHTPLYCPGILSTGDLETVEAVSLAGHSTDGAEHEGRASEPTKQEPQLQ